MRFCLNLWLEIKNVARELTQKLTNYGSLQWHCVQFFATAGYPCPPLRNPSDHYLRCVNKDFDKVKKNGLSIRKARKHRIPQFDEEALKEYADPLDEKEIKDVVEKLINSYQLSEQALYTAKFIDKQTKVVSIYTVAINCKLPRCVKVK